MTCCIGPFPEEGLIPRSATWTVRVRLRTAIEDPRKSSLTRVSAMLAVVQIIDDTLTTWATRSGKSCRQ